MSTETPKSGLDEGEYPSPLVAGSRCDTHDSRTHELRGGYRWCLIGGHEIAPAMEEAA